jgi:hypothetical protein
MYKIIYDYTIPEDQPAEFYEVSPEVVSYSIEKYSDHILVNEKMFSEDGRKLTQVLIFDSKENYLKYSSDMFLNEHNFLPKKLWNDQRGISMSVYFEDMKDFEF